MPNKKNRAQIKTGILSNIYDNAIHDESEEIAKNDKLFEKIRKIISNLKPGDLFLESEETFNLSITGPEVQLLAEALLLNERTIVAKHYIKNQKVKNQECWVTVAETLLLKKVGKGSKYDSGALYEYQARINSGLSANKAAKKVNEKYNFPSQETCNDWIHDEIKRNEDRGISLYSHLAKPSKSPT